MTKRRRSRKPSLDWLEPRDNCSLTPMISLLTAPVQGLGAGGVHPAASQATASDLTIDPTTGTLVNPNNGGSGITTDVSAPRPNEVARRVFRGTFQGKVATLPPRLFDQHQQFYFIAPGTTNQFLHGTLQLRYYTPEPGSGVFATTGTMAIADRSTGSGGLILADLVGDPSKVDRRGRPTHFDFSVNGGGGSGGIYASSVGSGTVDIAYQGNRARVTVRGSIFILGVGNGLAVFQTNR